jgi:RHS repeat-associated protein
VYSGGEHQVLLELEAGLDLDTGTTGQGAGVVEGIDSEEVEADSRMAARLQTGKPYADVGEAEVGDAVVAQDQDLGTLPGDGPMFGECQGTGGEVCGFDAGIPVFALGISGGIADALAFPRLKSPLNKESLGPVERFGVSDLKQEWEWLPEVHLAGTPFACEGSGHAAIDKDAGECVEVAMHWRWSYSYKESGETVSESGTHGFAYSWAWPQDSAVQVPLACPSVSWVVCETLESEGAESEGYRYSTHASRLYVVLNAAPTQLAFPAKGLESLSTTTERVPEARAMSKLATPVKTSALASSTGGLELFIAHENEKGLMPGIEGPGVPSPFLSAREQERFGMGSAATPDQGSCYKGKPVNCATGNEVASQTDLSVGGRGPALSLGLTYNSALAVHQTQPGGAAPGVFGYGWTSSFSDHLELGYESREATVYQANGSTVNFVRSGEAWAPTDAGVEATLADEGSGYAYTLPDQTMLHFNGSGQITSEVDRNGNALTMSRNSEGRLEAIKDSAGREITLKYNSEGRVESASDPMGHTVKYTYEGGNLASATLPGETSPRWQYKYNSSHELTSETDGRGDTTSTEYNAASQVISQTEPLSRTRKWAYTATTLGTETTITEPNGSTTVETFNQYGSPTSITRAAGTSLEATTTDTYNSVDELTASTNPEDETIEYGYDSAGDLTSEKNPDGDETKWEYDSTHDITSMTTATGEKTTIERDSHGNAIKVSRPAPGETTQTTRYKYDTDGDVESMIDPLGHEWKYEYDSYGDRKAEVDPEANRRTWGYNEDSQETSTVSPRGHASGAKESSFTTTIERDAQGRVTAVINPLKDKTEYTYNADSDLATVTDPEANKTTYSYDEDDEPIKVEQPNKTITETAYNAQGQITAQTDGDKHTTKYERNVLGEITEEVNPLAQKTVKEYDKAGNLTSVTDAEKRTTTYKYDPASRLVEVAYSDGKTPSVKYEYNADGSRTKMTDGTGETINTYDQLQRLTETKDGHGETVSYEYNLANEPTKITYPNDKAITRSYDNDDRLKSVTDWLEHTTTFAYNPDSELSTTTFPTATSDLDSYAYDDSDAMSEVVMKKSTETLSSLLYTRDKDAGVTKATSKGLPGEEKPAFSYSENSQLTKGAGIKYAYDDANNPTTIGEDAYTYNSADEIEKSTLKKVTVNTYTYNEVGQRTKTNPASGAATSYGYDQAGNLTTITRAKEGETPAIEDTYTYNGEGLRTTETINGTTSYLTWDTIELELPSILSNGTNSFIYGPNNLPVEQINSKEEATYLHHDQQGSTRLLTSSTGAVTGAYTYGPYGATEGHTGTATTPLGYDSQYTNSDTGLIYLRAREYDPSTAQFLTRDPWVALSGEPYSYVADNPLTFADPTGRCGFWCVTGIVAGGIALGTGVGEVVAGGAAIGGVSLGVISAVSGGVGAVADAKECAGGSGIACVGAGVGFVASGGAGAVAFGIATGTTAAGTTAIGLTASGIGSLGDVAGALASSNTPEGSTATGCG